MNCKKHDSLAIASFAIAAATYFFKINICCCCNGLAGYLLNQPGERPIYRILLQNGMAQQKKTESGVATQNLNGDSGIKGFYIINL